RIVITGPVNPTDLDIFTGRTRIIKILFVGTTQGKFIQTDNIPDPGSRKLITYSVASFIHCQSVYLMFAKGTAISQVALQSDLLILIESLGQGRGWRAGMLWNKFNFCI